MSWGTQVPIFLIVTGHTEANSAKGVFSGLTSFTHGIVFLANTHRVPQLGINRQATPGRDPRKAVTCLGKALEESIRWMKINTRGLVVILDDLESVHEDAGKAKYDAYRNELDNGIGRVHPERYAVHFLKTMLEAYFLADPNAVQRCLEVSIPHTPGLDVESIPNPASKIDDAVRQRKARHQRDDSVPGRYDKVEHGDEILKKLDMDVVLSSRDTCCWLRTLYKWTAVAAGFRPGRRFHLADGCLSAVTAAQIGPVHDGLVAGAELDEPG